MYEDRFVAFIDIIGWTAACQSESPSVLDRVKTSAEHLGEVAEEHSNTFYQQVAARLKEPANWIINPMHRAVRVSVFSDNLIISMPRNFGGRIASSIASRARTLLSHGFLTRGGIALGKMRHENHVAFGPALIAAVDLEKQAKMPRILCSPEVVDIFNSEVAAGENLIVRDRMGDWSVNLFSRVCRASEQDDLRLHRELFESEKLESVFSENIAATALCVHFREKWKYAQHAYLTAMHQFCSS